MQPPIELAASLTPTCCTTLQYLEGAAYIAVVLAVFGVPQLLTYYLDRRDRRRERREDRAESERTRREDLATAERIRREERDAAEQVRREERDAAEQVRREEREAAEQARREDLATAERIRREEREAAEQARREERDAAERRHQEMMTALTGTIAAILERNGHSAPTDQSAVIEELQQRVAELENQNASLRNGDSADGEG